MALPPTTPVPGLPHLDFVPQARQAATAAREAGHRVDALAVALRGLGAATAGVQVAGPGRLGALAELDVAIAGMHGALAAALPAILDALEGAALTVDRASTLDRWCEASSADGTTMSVMLPAAAMVEA
jgi:hypothetical protein